jgi:hypothetical protein
VDIFSLARLITVIKMKFKKEKEVSRPPSEENLQEKMLKTFRDKI